MGNAHWFLFALTGMLSFACMALALKKLTYSLPTPLILLYLFAITSIIYLGYNWKWGESLKIGWSALLLILLASIFAFIGNMCDVEALRLAPNAGYASAVKSGQILVITIASCFLFKDQQISWQGAFGVIMIFTGVGLLATQR